MRWQAVAFTIALIGSLGLARDANADFCGVDGSSPAEIQANIAKNPSFRPSAVTSRYISYLNTRTLTTLTFTTASNKAHPAAACRRAVRKGSAWYVVTSIKCGASKGACDTLVHEFNELDAQMSRQIRLKP